MTTLTLAAPFDPNRAVAHPIPVGGASFHHCRTVHGSGPNTTSRVRRAYINEWQMKPVKRATPADRPWYAARDAAMREHFWKTPA